MNDKLVTGALFAGGVIFGWYASTVISTKIAYRRYIKTRSA